MFVGQVILDLEEERQRHAQDTAEGDDVTYMLEKERERLTQQVPSPQKAQLLGGQLGRDVLKEEQEPPSLRHS